MTDFPSFGKIPRWNREVVVTEKIDGTNGLISIREIHNDEVDHSEEAVWLNGQWYGISAGSRNRWLTLEQDNHGFARWVHENAQELTKLGPGRHYGEWYGKGIQRGYGLDEKRFMLFNTSRWSDAIDRPECCEVSSVLYEGSMKDLMYPEYGPDGEFTGENHLDSLLYTLRTWGSWHVRGFHNPEGVVLYHKAANQLFKITLDNDSEPKGK